MHGTHTSDGALYSGTLNMWDLGTDADPIKPGLRGSGVTTRGFRVLGVLVLRCV